MKRLATLVGSMLLGSFVAACGGDLAEATADPLATLKQGIAVGTIPVTTPGQINRGGDRYRHEIDLVYGGQCTFTTSLNTLQDSVMWLYDQNLSLLQFDDDSGPGLASQIQRTLTPGRYYVDVGGFSAIQTGNYDLVVSCANPVFFFENFYADEDAGQCNALAYGMIRTGFGDWTPPIRIDTDGRAGGCYQQFGVTDPTGVLAGLNLAVNFYADGNADQCNFPGYRTIPISSSTNVQWSYGYRIDADNRAGGCWQVFYLSGRNDIALDIEFLPDGNPGQCNNAGTHTVTSSNSVAIRIDTDSRSGGCTQRFRLRYQ
ncbi:hypothetical protein [Vitiosangium sp. GDMCC 1.1324]|uniref:hypothetical protein n=1 Tax=Vitiosangium sp. (strain GDMCC 1.1324) TaxID=2138576 RepID=UPI0011B6E5CA|nr:hypothetical protein [Vitiosangium sp. GDMCC 1.1324]